METPIPKKPKKPKATECDCTGNEVEVLYKLHRMNPTKFAVRPSVLVCKGCGKRTNVAAVGFTLNVKEDNGQD